VSLKQAIRSYDKTTQLDQLEKAAERAIAGKRGAPSKRMFVNARHVAIVALLGLAEPYAPTASGWEAQKMQRQGRGLARMAQLYFDEHGSTRGDYRSTNVVDYVGPGLAAQVPYCDSGHAGLALIEVTRKRVYAKSSKWYPKETSSRFVVGRNESGTFFAHAVPSGLASVRSAIDWIWRSCSNQIVRRQGDIAVIRGLGPKMPNLPSGHVVRLGPGAIEHATHPPIRLPGHGERVIVARRAMTHSAEETRD